MAHNKPQPPGRCILLSLGFWMSLAKESKIKATITTDWFGNNFHNVFAFSFVEAHGNGHGYTVPLCDVAGVAQFQDCWVDNMNIIWLMCESLGPLDAQTLCMKQHRSTLKKNVLWWYALLRDRFFEVALSVIATTARNVWTTFIGLFSGICQNRVSSRWKCWDLQTCVCVFPPKADGKKKKRWNLSFYERNI